MFNATLILSHFDVFKLKWKYCIIPKFILMKYSRCFVYTLNGLNCIVELVCFVFWKMGKVWFESGQKRSFLARFGPRFGCPQNRTMDRIG